jgi:hypothetical protein
MAQAKLLRFYVGAIFFTNIKHMTKRFYQEEDGRWYIDLPEYINEGVGTKANLEMVAGADTLLSTLAQGETSIHVRFSNESFEGYTIKLDRSSDYAYTEEFKDIDIDPGAYYTVSNTNDTVWLCPVTRYVFNDNYPKTIFFQKVKSL